MVPWFEFRDRDESRPIAGSTYNPAHYGPIVARPYDRKVQASHVEYRSRGDLVIGRGLQAAIEDITSRQESD